MYRLEVDSLGEVKVPKDAKWGAQTQRSLENFKIGEEKIPLSVIKALIQIKKLAQWSTKAKGNSRKISVILFKRLAKLYLIPPQ